MATYTPRYNLKKPAGSDNVNVADLNGNMDKLDQAVGGLSDGKYEKPQSGIPKSDLAASVRGSLEKADSALQKYNIVYTVEEG